MTLEQASATAIMGKITVDVGDPVYTVGFEGRWLVAPDPDKTRTAEEGNDARI